MEAWEPPQQKPATTSLPFADGSAFAYSAAAFRSPMIWSVGNFLRAMSSSFWPGKELVPPPFGPAPERKSGAMAMYPAAAISSADSRAQSVRPELSWITSTAVALSFTSG